MTAQTAVRMTAAAFLELPESTLPVELLDGEVSRSPAPELVIAVFSPGSIRRDKKHKFHLYQQHGVREYWMIDPFEGYSEVYRHENGRLVLHGVCEPGDPFASATLDGQSVEVSTIVSQQG